MGSGRRRPCAVGGLLALLASPVVLAGCAGPNAAGAERKTPPPWAAGLSIGDPESTGGDGERPAGPRWSVVDDGEPVEPIDFPTCEQARDSHVEAYDASGHRGPKDLSVEQFEALLGRGAYLDGCGVAPSSDVSVCAAVIDGQAVGVTVDLAPFDQRSVNCIVEAVRAMSFPAHPRMDIARSRFRGE